jgi:hypothetical protein
VGDRLVAINGVATARLSHTEIMTLLRGAGPDVRLQLAYDLDDAAGLPKTAEKITGKREKISPSSKPFPTKFADIELREEDEEDAADVGCLIKK